MHSTKTKDPFVLTVFGASGDLAQIKLFPALYTMARQKRFTKKYMIVGFARSEMSQEEFRSFVEKSIKDNSKEKVDKRALKEFLKSIHYFQGQYKDKKAYKEYQTFLKQKGKTPKMAHIAYLSVPPMVFESIIDGLAKARKSKREDIRLVIEKPFGHDSRSADKLFHFVSSRFHEDQVYLLDHYLGKSQVQSVLNMRHSNRILSNIMQGSEIANIQITAFESVGVEHRIGYFDEVGIVRDMIQSHLLQVLALVTMEIPGRMTSESLQREKYNIISSIDCPPHKENVVLGQYAGYKSQKGVPKGSRTETFAAVRLFLDKQKWRKVPIYIRTGKRLDEKHTYVVIEFEKFDFQSESEQPNRLIIEFAPDARINISLINWQEGAAQYQNITTAESIACNVAGCLPEHGDLLLDAMNKERVHFLSFSEVIACWDVVDEITLAAKKGHLRVQSYKPGGRGPKSHCKLPELDGFKWYDVH